MKIVFYLIISYLLMVSLQLKTGEWYSQEVMFSDWKGRPCDYSTNAIVTQWYNGGHPKYFRQENIQKFINEPDTVTLGLDYYALYPISGQFLPFLFEAQNEWVVKKLRAGDVLVVRSYKGVLF